VYRLQSRPMDRAHRIVSWKQTVIALLLFGTAFGYVEAAVVSYLRFLHEPVRRRFYPDRQPGELFPLLTREQVAAADPEQHRVLLMEIGREAATIVMLAGTALAVATDLAVWAAAFVIAFGAWDITFYLFLKILLDWPASPYTWDILFIIPVPWVSPVLAPVLVSAAMIGAGIWHLRRKAIDNPVRLGRLNWTGIVVGATTIIVSFTLDYRNVVRAGMPNPFHWTLFGIGMTIGVVSYASAAVGSRARSRRAVVA
jgi:hypothetical protein